MEYEIIEGMPLIIEFKVYGYPHPLVSLSHNENIVLKRTDAEPIYIRQNASELYNGDYTFTAENSLGNISITVKVKVVGESFSIIDWLNWLTHWLTDWLIDWSINRLIDWLIERGRERGSATFRLSCGCTAGFRLPLCFSSCLFSKNSNQQ